MLREREELACSLPSHKRKDLDVMASGSLPVKKSRLELEVTEDGVHLMPIQYTR